MKDWERFVLVMILLLVMGQSCHNMNFRWKLANGQVTVRCQ